MITKKAEYAIMALAELALQGIGTKVTTAEIARRRQIPANLTVQLISKLRDAGLVTSARGPAGGVQLAQEPDSINLRKIIEIIDGPMVITRCLLREEPCRSRTGCKLRGIWAEAQAKMLEVLEGVTIIELAEAVVENDTQ